ncbi:TadE/TadG family type IV pilus assembly protein [Vibrio sp. qd031]|uniref:TadE/TadG family type IV pilus assembly protein n=1 Tax=Vibrio sp. qd031 TaxID=1603038 RepID=UPI000A1217F6|nr:TadE/TadG family type IV pilus assembly protein [Vibrio sp. qd031]
MHKFKKQKGVAALFFILLVPPLFGIYSLGTDGALMIQNKARMNDALEVASLAVSALDDPNWPVYAEGEAPADFLGSDDSIAVAKTYIEQYMGNANEVDWVKVEKLSCDEIVACKAGLANGEQSYYQYQVYASSNHNVLYPNLMAGGDSEYTVGATGISEKYQGLPVDVVLVADYSGSMLDNWNNTPKYEQVYDVISKVTEKIDDANEVSVAQDSTIAITGFNSFPNVTDSSDNNCYMEMLHLNYTLNQNEDVTARSIDYTGTITAANLRNGELALNRKRIPYYDKIVYVIEDATSDPEIRLRSDESNNNGEITKVADDVNGRVYVTSKEGGKIYKYTKDADGKVSRYRYKSNQNVWEQQSENTVFEIIVSECLNLSRITDYERGFEDATFHDVDLTSEFSTINNKVASFLPNWATASHQGIIRGAQIAAKGSNPRKLIIVLSDGVDQHKNPYITSGTSNLGTISSTLYGNQYSMCDAIKTALDQDTFNVDLGNSTAVDLQVESSIFVIGFDYELSGNLALTTCAGSENVYLAQNSDEILSTILELISEEVGHLR